MSATRQKDLATLVKTGSSIRLDAARAFTSLGLQAGIIDSALHANVVDPFESVGRLRCRRKTKFEQKRMAFGAGYQLPKSWTRPPLTLDGQQDGYLHDADGSPRASEHGGDGTRVAWK